MDVEKLSLLHASGRSSDNTRKVPKVRHEVAARRYKIRPAPPRRQEPADDALAGNGRLVLDVTRHTAETLSLTVSSRAKTSKWSAAASSRTQRAHLRFGGKRR